MAFGLSGVVPAIHYVIMEGWFNDISRASLGWLVLMGLLYILGAIFYALRIPERWFPGKFDLWVSSFCFEDCAYLYRDSFLGTITSNIPHLGDHCGSRSFPWNIRNGSEPSFVGRVRCTSLSYRVVIHL